MRGRPIRGFFAGLFLGLALDLDLVLSGAVNLDDAILTILPVVLIVLGVALGMWAPVGRKRKTAKTAPAPLPTPVAWPESAPVEGSTQHAASTLQQMAPPAMPPPLPPATPPPDPPAESQLRTAGRVAAVDLTARRHPAGMRRMDFNDSPEEAAWRAECRDWLEANTPAVASTAPRDVMFEPGGDNYLARAKKWQATKFDAGFARITWEPEFGGRNGTTMQQIIFGQEEGRYAVPTEVFVIGLGMIAPTLRACGTDAQKERYLTKLLRGEEIWSQLFSEPGAGSDVASLSMTAVRDGEEWVINGQKVWTSGAQFSDYGEIICRTNPDAEKHKGITAFIVDLRAPGVTIKPLKQMNGGSGFNEVFFDDVRVPADHVLGGVHEGWTVAITTLMNERVAIGSGGGGGGRGSVQDLIDLARRRSLDTDPVVRQRLADLYIKSRIQKFAGMRTLTAASQGKVPGPEGSIGKLFGGRVLTEIGALAIDILGASAVACVDDDYRWHQPLLGAPAAHIAGGSDEVMKNIIGERVLGLPGEPRVDKGVPWKEVLR